MSIPSSAPQRVDRHGQLYRDACARSAEALLDSIEAEGPGGSWAKTGRLLWPLRLALWGGMAEGEARSRVGEVLRAIGRPPNAARRHVTEATRRNASDGPPSLPDDAWTALLAAAANEGPARSPKPSRPRRPRLPAFRPVNYPDRSEVAQLWRRCVPVDSDSEVAAAMAARGIDPAAAARLDLARALPPRVPAPSWARFGSQSWGRAGFRWIVPLWDAEGRLRSLRARRVSGSRGPKSASPVGAAVSGLVFACPRALDLLRGVEPAGQVAAVFVEGELDHALLALAPLRADGEAELEAGLCPGRVAVFGIAAGAWTEALATRIPLGSHWLAATDCPEPGKEPAEGLAPGDGYAVEVFVSAEAREPASLRRAKPSRLRGLGAEEDRGAAFAQRWERVSDWGDLADRREAAPLLDPTDVQLGALWAALASTAKHVRVPEVLATLTRRRLAARRLAASGEAA